MGIEAKRRYILVLEDDPGICELVAWCYIEEGHNVRRAESWEEAEATVESALVEGEEPCAYSGDYNLIGGPNPGEKTGLAFGLKLRERFPCMRIALVTGSMDRPEVKAFIEGKREGDVVIDKYDRKKTFLDQVQSLAQRWREECPFSQCLAAV